MVATVADVRGEEAAERQKSPPLHSSTGLSGEEPGLLHQVSLEPISSLLKVFTRRTRSRATKAAVWRDGGRSLQPSTAANRKISGSIRNLMMVVKTACGVGQEVISSSVRARLAAFPPQLCAKENPFLCRCFHFELYTIIFFVLKRPIGQPKSFERKH